MFSPLQLGPLRLPRRVLRSATFEGMCDGNGLPTPRYLALYRDLASRGLGAIVTGFVYVSREGRAMQPGQGGMDGPDKVAAFREVTAAVREAGVPFILQVAHAGRQTRSCATLMEVVGASTKRSLYFRSKPRALRTEEAAALAERFGEAAMWARDAGFDGVQLHAAHGYLIHQFLHPSICDRTDEYGIDPLTGIGTRFLEHCIAAARAKAGADFPLWVKVSHGDDLHRPMTSSHFEALIGFLHRMRVSCIEVSYGTMDYPMSIFRGDVPARAVLAHNPMFATRHPVGRALFHGAVLPFMKHRQQPFSPGYNLAAACHAAQLTDVPVFAVGGLRDGEHMEAALRGSKLAGLSLCRPFLREPDFMAKLEANPRTTSACTNCNLCAVMCDSENETRCYAK